MVRKHADRWQRRSILAAGLAAGGAMALPASARQKLKRPNVIMIVADDLGFADLHCYGHRTHQTPHIDSLAHDGILFDQAYANSAVCSATRIALITGRYQYRLRAGLDEPLAGREEFGLPADHPTLPSLLARAGYRTGLIGKWHMGTPPLYGPLASGYERFFGIYGGATDYFTHSMKPPQAHVDLGGLIDQAEPTEREGYISDVFGDEAVRFISQSKDDARPFFLSLHFTAPHWPWQGPEDADQGPVKGNPMQPGGGNLATFRAMVENMDENVGKVLGALEAAGLADDTIVIFTSDNGGERFSDVWPLIGAKTELLEGGIRVPLLVRWNGRIAKGSRSTQPAMSMDLLPTLLPLCGACVDPGYPSDGIDLTPILISSMEPAPRKLYWRYKAMEQAAFRDGDWKYLRINGQEHLYNLAQDERERADLKNRYPAKLEAMKAAFASWNAGMLPYPPDTASHNVKQDDWADRY